MQVVKVLVLGFVLFLLAAMLALAEAPTTVGYQGRLTDSSGNPITDTLSITFGLYASSEGGAAAWTESQSVEVKNGLFSVLLGEDIDLQSDVLNLNSYLGIKVGSDNEMSPRQYLSSVPYARTLAPGAVVSGTLDGPLFSVENSGDGSAIKGRTEATSGAWANGITGVLGHSENDQTYGVLGWSNRGAALAGVSTNSGNEHPAAQGWNMGGGDGVEGYSASKRGVYGHTIATSDDWENGIAGVVGESENDQTYGVLGWSNWGIPVEGVSTNSENGYPAVEGYNIGGGTGVRGYSQNDDGVKGETDAAPSGWEENMAGVSGESENEYTFGVRGLSHYGIGVSGFITTSGNAYPATQGWNMGGGDGVEGYSENKRGVWGHTIADPGDWYAGIAGVRGESEYDQTSGVLGLSHYGKPVLGVNETTENSNAAVTGASTGGGDGVEGYSQYHYGVYAQSDNSYSLYVDGTAFFSETVTFNDGFNDVAEMFDAPSQSLSPGDVAVLDPDGGLAVKLAERAYDTTVAGVVSSKPAIVLPATVDMSNGVPLALTGRVKCKVDAQYGSIGVGDLLTTSSTPGHAMRVADRAQATGAIVGKAMEPWESGTGTILILVTLQ